MTLSRLWVSVPYSFGPCEFSRGPSLTAALPYVEGLISSASHVTVLLLTAILGALSIHVILYGSRTLVRVAGSDSAVGPISLPRPSSSSSPGHSYSSLLASPTASSGYSVETFPDSPSMGRTSHGRLVDSSFDVRNLSSGEYYSNGDERIYYANGGIVMAPERLFSGAVEISDSKSVIPYMDPEVRLPPSSRPLMVYKPGLGLSPSDLEKDFREYAMTLGPNQQAYFKGSRYVWDEQRQGTQHVGRGFIGGADVSSLPIIQRLDAVSEIQSGGFLEDGQFRFTKLDARYMMVTPTGVTASNPDRYHIDSSSLADEQSRKKAFDASQKKLWENLAKSGKKQGDDLWK